MSDGREQRQEEEERRKWEQERQLREGFAPPRDDPYRPERQES